MIWAGNQTKKRCQKQTENACSNCKKVYIVVDNLYIMIYNVISSREG